MNLFQAGMPSLIAGLEAGFGLAAIYRREATDIACTVIDQGGGTDQQYMTQLGDSPENTYYTLYPPELGYAGYSVKVADLVTLDPPNPQRGDKIIIGVKAFLLSAPPGMAPWRMEDPATGVWFRCHTKAS